MATESASPSSGRRWWVVLAVAAVALSIAGRWGLERWTRTALPAHLLGHKAVFVPELFDAATQRSLLELLASKGRIPSNSADLSFYTTKHEHIGEAVAAAADGTCAHPYLIPATTNKSLCVLPGRFDIARAFALTGGFNGLKEDLDTLFSRLQSFGVYLFDLASEEHAVIRSLFASETFQKAAREVCPEDKQHLDPFQFNFIVGVPGQAVPTHIDGVYFWGASRFSFPQWLLAVMSFSGLFQDLFVDQVQVVGYASAWSADDMDIAERAAGPGPSALGEFVYWNDAGDALGRRMAPLPRSGNAVDGSKTVHTTTVYRPDVTPPFLDKNRKSSLEHRKSGGGGGGSDALAGRWDLRVDDDVLASYATSDLRVSIVYRARCFGDAEEAQRYNAQLKDESKMLELDDVLAKLVEHGEKAFGKSAPPVHDLGRRLDLAMWLLDTYVRYPFPHPSTAWMPFNYCALFRSPPGLGLC